LMKESSTLAGHLQGAPPPSQAELKKQGDALIAAAEAKPQSPIQ